MKKHFVVMMTPFQQWDNVTASSPSAAIALIRKTDFPMQIEKCESPHRLGAKKTRQGYRVYLFTDHAGDRVKAVNASEAILKAGLQPFVKKSIPHIFLVNGKVVEKSDDGIIME